MGKYLIVNSDDFGISEGVSRGILEAHHTGIVTSTTTMVNMPAAEEAVRTAQKTAPNLGLGLHFTLSFGVPVSDPASIQSLITNEGRFVSNYAGLMEKLPHFTTEDLEREMLAQFERFRQIARCLPDHLDSHHGATYTHPGAFDVMVRLANEHNLPIRWSEAIDKRYNLDSNIVDSLQASIAKHGKPRTTGNLVDLIFDFESTSRIERLKSGLQTIQEGYSELVVHVGYADNLEEDYSFQREQELTAVTDEEVKQIIEEEGIQLCKFGDLP